MSPKNKDYLMNFADISKEDELQEFIDNVLKGDVTAEQSIGNSKTIKDATTTFERMFVQ